MCSATWGDTVRIKDGAPRGLRPGALAKVVDVGEIETVEHGRAMRAAVGSKVYVIEFDDGNVVEIAGSWLVVASLTDPLHWARARLSTGTS